MKFGWFSRHHGWWWFVCLALSKLGTYIQIHGCVIIVVLKSPLDRGLSSIFGQIHVILLAEYPLLSHYNPWWSMNDIFLPCFRIWILRFLDGPPKPVHFFLGQFNRESAQTLPTQTWGIPQRLESEPFWPEIRRIFFRPLLMDFHHILMFEPWFYLKIWPKICHKFGFEPWFYFKNMAKNMANWRLTQYSDVIPHPILSHYIPHWLIVKSMVNDRNKSLGGWSDHRTISLMPGTKSMAAEVNV